MFRDAEIVSPKSSTVHGAIDGGNAPSKASGNRRFKLGPDCVISFYDLARVSLKEFK